MTFLPIVHRELRVASRRRGTYIARSVVAGIILLLWLFVVASHSRHMTASELGQDLFWTYGVLATLYALFAGVLFTAEPVFTEAIPATYGRFDPQKAPECRSE